MGLNDFGSGGWETSSTGAPNTTDTGGHNKLGWVKHPRRQRDLRARMGDGDTRGATLPSLRKPDRVRTRSTTMRATYGLVRATSVSTA